MKCNYCGGNLSLRDELCPHCGRVNRDAAQHIRDMRHYRGEFEETKEEVYTESRWHSGISSKVILLAVLVVLIVVFVLIENFFYEVSYRAKKMMAALRTETYCERLENYLEKEEYIELQAFAAAKRLQYTDGYEKYESVIGAAQSYANVSVQIMEFSQAEEEELSEQAEYLADSMEYFYKWSDMGYYDWMKETSTEENETALKQMRENIKALLMTYCGLTEEETEQLETMSNAKRAILLETGVRRDE